MASVINGNKTTEKDCYFEIKSILGDLSFESLNKAQKIFDEALRNGVWQNPMGENGCSYETYELSLEKNYCILSTDLIQSSREALSDASASSQSSSFAVFSPLVFTKVLPKK